MELSCIDKHRWFMLTKYIYLSKSYHKPLTKTLVNMMISSLIMRFYSLLILFYFSDMILLLGNIWSSYKLTSSPVFLGVTLSLGTLLPLIFRKNILLKNKDVISISHLYYRRIIIYSALLIISLMHYSNTKIGLIAISLSIGYLSFVTLSTLEAQNSKLVLEGHISSHKASRIMQTLIQIGSFFGAMASGYLLTNVSYNKLITILCLFDIVISIFGILIFNNENKTITEDSEEKSDNANGISKKLKYLSLAIGFIGLHICAFNTLTPILFQNIRNLNGEFYGMCSGVAGIGAFLAAFVNMKSFKFMLPAIILIMADIVFSLSNVPLLLLISCFIIGFSINTIRINLRIEIIDATRNKNEANTVAKYSAAIYSFSQSFGPLAFGLLVSNLLLGVNASIYLIPIVGVSIFIFIVSQSGSPQKC